MGQRKKAAIEAVALAAICGLLTWHAVHWHSSGVYLEMFNWIGTSKGYLTVLYNVGMMLVLGVTLGLLMERITRIFGYRIGKIKHLTDEEANDEAGRGRAE